MKTEDVVENSKIRKAAECLKKLHYKNLLLNKNKILLDESAERIMLQISFKKVPKTSGPTTLKLVIPHPLVTDLKDVCLITSDVNLKNFDNEKTVKHYKDILSKHGLSVGEIIPYRQLRAEYKSFESLRQLCEAFDLFLADGRISKMLCAALGKVFIRKKKLPMLVNLNSTTLKSDVKWAISKTTIYLSGKGSICATIVGNMKMEDEKLFENINAVINSLPGLAPGGWKNINSLHLKTPMSKAIPIYINLESSNHVEVPNLVPPQSQPVIDDLDTLVMSKIKIFPSGHFELIKNIKQEDNIENEVTPFEKELLHPKNTPKRRAVLLRKDRRRKAIKLKADARKEIEDKKEIPKAKKFKAIKKKQVILKAKIQGKLEKDTEFPKTKKLRTF